MAKKRKLNSRLAAHPESSKLEAETEGQVEQNEFIEEQDPDDIENQDGVEEEEEEEEGDEEDDENHAIQNQIPESSDVNQNNNAADESGDEAVRELLEPFSKEQLINFLSEAAAKHGDVADRIHGLADEDPSHRKIFIHGLGWDANTEALMDAFKQYGEMEDCRVVTDKISGKCKGYGFILFKSRSGVRKALKQPQKMIGNRMTGCQLASTGPVPSGAVATTGATAPAHQVSEYTQRKIFVTNVGAELDPQKLITFFSNYGEIEEGPLGLDRQTGRPKGFCLFVYKTIESAKKALEEPYKNFEGHTLHCQKAIDGPKTNKPHPHPRKHNSHAAQNMGFVGNARVASAGTGAGHLMAPAAASGAPFNQGAAATQALNPALGQALTAFLTQGAGLGLPNLLGTLGAAGVGGVVNPPTMPGTGASTAPAMQGGFGNPGVAGGAVGGYGGGAVGGYSHQGGYANQQMGQGGSGRTQHGVGYMGGMGH